MKKMIIILKIILFIKEVNKMGLDMFLDGCKFLDENKNWLKDEDGKKITVKTSEIYWRKANAIHYWFVDNVQDGEDNCLPHCCEIDSLIELRNVCKEVLNDNSKAEELLPVYEGFFFGSYDYDEWYFEDIKKTYNELNRIIKEDKYDYFEYYSSW